MTVTYRQLVENGEKGEKQVVSEVPTVEPTPKIIGIGSYANPKWDELATCESGGRWDTVDSGPDGYDGGLGIYRGTWRGVRRHRVRAQRRPRHARAADHRRACGSTRSSAGTRGDVRTTSCTGRNGACDPAHVIAWGSGRADL